MDFKDRTLCKLLQKSVAKQDPSTYEPWMKALMEGHGTDLRLDGQKVPGAAFLLDSGAAEARIRSADKL